MKLRFWGVRADLAIPSAGTLRYGGNTICATVTCGENQLCILDAGFGLTVLGHSLMAAEFGQGKGNALILISHNNWDHTQGIGFFGPFFKKGNRFTFYGLGSEEFNFYDRLETQLYPALSPLQTLNHLEAQLSFRESSPRAFQWGGIQVQSALMPPGVEYGGGYRPLAYRLTEAGRSLVYITEAEYPDGHLPERFVEFCRGADLMIHDAYFTAEDYRPGWGHGPVALAVELAQQAGIPRLVLYHYNPTYDDALIDAMVQACQGNSGLQVLGAQEGLEILI
jgi:phosphoribosyl 1,2-cyclic phosphodiesterase